MQLTRAERCSLAADRFTSTEVLIELASDPSYRVRREVAGNLAAPAEVLQQLAGDHSSQVRIRVATNPSTLPEALAALSEDESSIVRQRVAGNAASPVAVVARGLADRTAEVRTTAVWALAQRQALHEVDPTTLLRSVRSLYVGLQRQVAQNPSAPTAVVDGLLEDPEIAPWAAGNPSASPEALERAAQDADDDELVLTIASNPSTPPEVLRTMVGDRPPALRAILARNPGTPSAVVAKLARHDRWSVRAGVAQNPNASPAVLTRLGSDASWSVRHAVAANPATPAEELVRLAGDIRAVALVVAANPSAPPDALAKLVAHDSPWVRGLALGHPAAPVWALRDAGEALRAPAWVLARIARNPSCPDDVRDAASTWLMVGGAIDQDPDFDPVRCTGNPGATTEAPAANYEAIRKAQGIRGGLHPLWAVRALAADGPDLTPGAWARLMKDPVPDVRRRVIRRANMRHSVWRELVSDPDPVVRSNARQTVETLPTSPTVVRTNALKTSPFSGGPSFRIAWLAIMLTLALSRMIQGGCEQPEDERPPVSDPLDAILESVVEDP
jgi:hypothetical protein